MNSKFIGAFYDRINIQVPEALKADLRFTNKPCDPRKTLNISILPHYQKATALTSIFNMGFEFTPPPLTVIALPGRPFYTVEVFATGTRSFVGRSQPIAFSNRYGSVDVGCEDSASTNVSWNAPPEAKEFNGSARWIDTSNLKSQSASAPITGSVIAAQGTIGGLDKQGFGIKNCPGGGHATLDVYGTYYVDETKSRPYQYAAYSALIRDPISFTLPIEVLPLRIRKTIHTQMSLPPISNYQSSTS